MAILAFQKPDKVVMLESDDTFGKFEFRPLEPGFGITIGNALRRILLSSLEGFAITSIRIEGVDHEFSTIPGVIEDVTEIILNIKKIRFKQIVDGQNFEKAVITISNQEQFRAGDIEKFLTNFKVLNPGQLICNIDSSKNNTHFFRQSDLTGYLFLNAVVHCIAITDLGKHIHSTQNAELIKHLIAGNF